MVVVVGYINPELDDTVILRVGRKIMVSQVKVGFFVFAIAVSVASALTILSRLA